MSPCPGPSTGRRLIAGFIFVLMRFKSLRKSVVIIECIKDDIYWPAGGDYAGCRRCPTV